MTATAIRRIVTTEELIALLAQGKKVRLPAVAEFSPEVRAHYDAAELDRVNVQGAAIAEVRYRGEDAVQCIRVADEEHLYLTDNFIPTHNTSNIIFLKSTDDSMIETLSKMSGVWHKSYRDSKTVTKDVEKLMLRNEGKVSYTTTTKEEPVISYTDLATLPMRNSIVFRAGDPPIWNRNETIMPMSHALFRKTIVHPGHNYSLQTIPTLSSAQEFDVRRNQPDFSVMLAKRINQAIKAATAMDIYTEAYGYDERAIELLDPDVLANDLMEVIDAMIAREDYENAQKAGVEVDEYGKRVDAQGRTSDEANTGAGVGAGDAQRAAAMNAAADDNDDLLEEAEALRARREEHERKRFARGTVSYEFIMWMPKQEGVRPNTKNNIDNELATAYERSIHAFERDERFRVTEDRELIFAQTNEKFVRVRGDDSDLAKMQSYSEDDDAPVYSEDKDVVDSTLKYKVTDEFKYWLYSLSSWADIADGNFEQALADAMLLVERQSGSTSDAAGQYDPKDY